MREVPIDQLDAVLNDIDAGYAISHDEAYKRFGEIRMLPPEDLPADPFSPEYRARYLKLYEQISTRTGYTSDSEKSKFDLEARVLRPFPFYTNSVKLAGVHYSRIGKLFESMDLKAGSDVLEFGFGYGHTTLALAMLGHNVTAVDISEDFCNLVRRRAELHQVDNLNVINDEFMWAETTEQKFDAVVFFECFHHCWEFERLLKALHRILKPGGKLYFGAEPIADDFAVPWGTRLDGESLFVARRWGWMELGFRSDYFAELLRRSGWIGREFCPLFWVASSRREPIVLQATDSRLLSQIGERVGDTLNCVAPGTDENRHYAVYGPYLSLPKGHWSVELKGAVGHAVRADHATFDVACDSGRRILFSRPCTESDMESGCFTASFAIDETTEALEVRLLVPGGFTAQFERLSFQALD